MITPAQRAEIRRLYYGEHWKLGTIAAQLGLHRETVRAAVDHESGAGRRGVYRPSALDPYLPFIRDTLAQYPSLRATRIHEMVRQRGYPGSVNQLRRIVKRLRPETGRTVYRRVVTLTGESAQVDWGSFGKVRIGHGTRAVSGFVMVLGYSRAIAALFTLDQTLESFLRGHVEAFDALGGTARTLVYDNLRSAVLDRRGAAVQFHPRLLELAGHYHFAPRPCTPGRGNEKGKIERQIQYLRHAFFAARPFRDLDDLNAQFRRWRDDVAHQRRHPEQPDRTVAEVWADEKPRLLPLPAHPFETELVRVVRSGKTPYVRFDRNLYSIPHTHVRKPLTLLASDTRVRILDQQTELARHRRTYDTAQTVEDPAHLEGLLVATATRKRWSTTVMLEHIARAELEDRQRRSVERRLTCARLGRFKPLADWDWDWPTAFDRPALERILTLDFLARGENVILVGAQGLGKTMLAKNVAHQAILAGHSALFTTAAGLLLDLNGQETARALERRLRHYTRPSLLVVDEVGFLAYDARAADLLFQLVSRRYEHRSLLITTNLPFKHWDTVFPNASCAVALIDRLTHHVEILVVEGRSYRRREAELTQQQRKRRRRSDPSHDDDPPPRRRQRGPSTSVEK